MASLACTAVAAMTDMELRPPVPSEAVQLLVRALAERAWRLIDDDRRRGPLPAPWDPRERLDPWLPRAPAPAPTSTTVGSPRTSDAADGEGHQRRQSWLAARLASLAASLEGSQTEE